MKLTFQRATKTLRDEKYFERNERKILIASGVLQRHKPLRLQNCAKLYVDRNPIEAISLLYTCKKKYIIPLQELIWGKYFQP